MTSKTMHQLKAKYGNPLRRAYLKRRVLATAPGVLALAALFGAQAYSGDALINPGDMPGFALILALAGILCALYILKPWYTEVSTDEYDHLEELVQQSDRADKMVRTEFDRVGYVSQGGFEVIGRTEPLQYRGGTKRL